MSEFVEKTNRGWLLRGGGLQIAVSADNGRMTALGVHRESGLLEWSPAPGDVKVRDDLARCEFEARDLEHLKIETSSPKKLVLIKKYRGAPWTLEETWAPDGDAVSWRTRVRLDAGDFRSIAVTLHIPWPQPLYPMRMWAAAKNMPSAPHMFAELALEYGEITSGITIPAFQAYLERENAGLLLAMPFEFRTPRLRFLSGYREPDLRVRFDWLALRPGASANTALLLRGTGGAWRPALKWLYERYRAWFEPAAKNIWNLFGGHVSGKAHVSEAELKTMLELGLKWYELHGHFPAYGNYHPENLARWRSGHHRKDETILSVESIRETIKRLKASGTSVFPYLQVTGDGDSNRLPKEILDCRIRDRRGKTVSAWPGTEILNSDPRFAFGKDITRQINGMIERYPEIDGVFVDQAGYNFIDASRDDGITAIDNKPVYMTGFNYCSHLKHLADLIHAKGGALIANAPLWIDSLKYFDAFMAEGSDWLCDHLQYGALAKPMFFLMYKSGDREIELMFQRCLLYGAGYASYPEAAPSKRLYEKYMPLVEMFRSRRWSFTARPIELPAGFDAAVYRSGSGDGLICPVIPSMTRALGEKGGICCRIDVSELEAPPAAVTARGVGGSSKKLKFGVEENFVTFDLPRGNEPMVVRVGTAPG